MVRPTDTAAGRACGCRGLLVRQAPRLCDGLHRSLRSSARRLARTFTSRKDGAKYLIQHTRNEFMDKAGCMVPGPHDSC